LQESEAKVHETALATEKVKADSRTAVASGLHAKAQADVVKAKSEAYKARAQVMVSLLAAKCSPSSALKMSRAAVPSPTAPPACAASTSPAPSSRSPPSPTALNRPNSVVTVLSPEKSLHAPEDQSPSGAALANHAPRTSPPLYTPPTAGRLGSGSQHRMASPPVAQTQHDASADVSRRTPDATSGSRQIGPAAASATVGEPLSHSPTGTPNAQDFVARLAQGLSSSALVLPSVQGLVMSLASICAANPSAGSLAPLLAIELSKVCDEESLTVAVQKINKILHNCVYASSKSVQSTVR
jgi:hypothetical protein